MIVSLYIGTSKLDMFNDESVEINSSIANIEDITKNQTDYTKDFTVPASDNNNQLFKHYYDADIDDGFDARVKVDGEIRLDGLPFRVGKYRLTKVAIKKGAPSSYTINFFGNLLSIKDKVGKDYLSDLDLSAFDHTYDSSTIKTGLTSSLFSGDMVYNLLTKKQYYYNSDVTDTTSTDTLENIAYGDGSDTNGISINDLRPSIRLIKIIEAIETDYDITFSRDFFGLTEFTDIFTWLNPDKDNNIGDFTKVIDFNGGSSVYVNQTTDIGTFTANAQDRWQFDVTITTPLLFFPQDILLSMYVDGVKVQEQSGSVVTGILTIPMNFTTNLYTNELATKEVYFTVTSQNYAVNVEWRQRRYDSSSTLLADETTTGIQNGSREFVMSNNLPKVKIIDFLKGLFNMFKLVVIQNDDETTYVDTLKNYYLKGNLIDVTSNIDFESTDVERGKILNEINFLFQEPTTVLNTTFESNTGIAYGDEETILKDTSGDVLDGETLEFTLPFETILFERLNDTDTGQQIDLQYGAIIDDSLEPVNPKMLLFYNILQKLNGASVSYVDFTGFVSTKESITTALNTASHTDSFIDPRFALLFGQEFSTWNGLTMNNTLYKNYHEDYILTIFNVKKRSYKFKAVLPLTTMLEMGLNDILQIKDSFYRIDNFTTNLTTGKVTLNLINSFDAVVNDFQVYPTNFLVTSVAQQVSSSVTNSTNLSVARQDVGDGIGWITTSISDGNIFIDIDESTQVNDRFMQLQVKPSGFPFETIYIQQLGIGNTLDFSDANNSSYLSLLTLRN